MRSLLLGASALLLAAASPASAAIVVTEIALSADGMGAPVPFTTGTMTSGSLTGTFGLSWNTTTNALAPDPVKNNGFSFVASPGLAQDNTTMLAGFAYNNANSMIVLNGGDSIVVTNPINPPGPHNRENVLYIQFVDPLIDLVDGTIAYDPIASQTMFPGLTQTTQPTAGECEPALPFPTGQFCYGNSRRFLGDGVATAVPEPSTYALYGLGLLALGFLRWRRA